MTEKPCPALPCTSTQRPRAWAARLKKRGFKKIVNTAGDFVSVAVAKGAVKDQVAPDRRANYVDGISGATLTGRYLSRGLETILREYEPVSVKFRKDHFKMVPPGQGICDTKAGKKQKE